MMMVGLRISMKIRTIFEILDNSFHFFLIGFILVFSNYLVILFIIINDIGIFN